MTTTDTKETAAVPAQAAHVPPPPAGSRKRPTQQKAAPKGRKRAPVAKSKAAVPRAPRPGSKAAHVIDLMRRKAGASLAAIMRSTGWQRHTVRGFVAGALRKAGYDVQSFLSARGERTYRITR